MTPHPAPPCRILLAGASGTIGSAVGRQLETEGHAVYALTRAALADRTELAAAMADVGRDPERWAEMAKASQDLADRGDADRFAHAVLHLISPDDPVAAADNSALRSHLGL